MNTERDKFLTEAMGCPWHEVVSINNFEVTCSCGMSAFMNPCDNLNFSTWDGFGKLWEWAQKQGWWIKIMLRFQDEGFYHYIQPDRFADAIYQKLA